MPQSDRSTIGKIGAHTLWAHVEDRSAHTSPARRAFHLKFEKLVDPEGVLAPDERARRAENLRKAHFTQMARNRWQKIRADSVQLDRVMALVGTDLATLTDAELIAAIANLGDPAPMPDATLARRIDMFSTAKTALDCVSTRSA